jgi:hypothetical protein
MYTSCREGERDGEKVVGTDWLLGEIYAYMDTPFSRIGSLEFLNQVTF